MKTLKTIFKGIFGPSESPPSKSGNKKPETKKTGNIKENIKNKESDNIDTNHKNTKNNYETETNESVGDTRMDTAVSPENSRIGKKESEIRSDFGNYRREESESVGSEKEEKAERQEKVSNDNFQEEIKKAYRKGVIDGRNQQIEERYFPMKEDGIPHFHGNPSTGNLTGDIFSMAREA